MRLAIRWTIGDVSTRGFAALAFSIAGARRIFGDDTKYVVCVNTIGVDSARKHVGAAADLVDWLDCSTMTPMWLMDHIDKGMAQGVAWKFAPLRLFPDRHLLSLDNDVILWQVPESVRLWLKDQDTLLIAEDISCCYGGFATKCPNEPRNSGIVGFPPGWEIETKLRELLRGVHLVSEGDEQGLQTAMITSEPHRVVGLGEVSISGYFRPHLLELGDCGAHFVGVNAKSSASTWLGRSSEQFTHEFWDEMEAEVARRVQAT